MQRAIGITGAVIGILTGLATIVGGVLANSSTIAEVTLTMTGGVFVAYASVLLTYMFITGGHFPLEEYWDSPLRWWLFWWLLFVAGTIAFLVILWTGGFAGMPFLQVMGWAALVASVGFAPRMINTVLYMQRAAVKTCPDCAERVKVQARVCRYCRFRWAEGSEDVGEAPASP